MRLLSFYPEGLVNFPLDYCVQQPVRDMLQNTVKCAVITADPCQNMTLVNSK